MQHWLKRVMMMVAVTVLSGNALAGTLQQQRAAFKAATGDIESGQLAQAAQEMASLQSYVLYPYLQHDYLKARIQDGDTVDGAVQVFLNKYSALPIAESLRVRWLHQLSARGDWQLFFKHYQPSRDPGLRCNAVLAHLRTDRSKGEKPASDKMLASDAIDLWATGRSRPKACDPVFAWMGEAGLLTPERYQQRVDLALASGHTHLADYLADSQEEEARQRTRARIALRTHPENWLEKVRDKKADFVGPDMVTNGLLHLARNHPAKAEALEESLADAHGLAKKQRSEVQRMVALGYAWDRRPEAMDKLAALNAGQVDETVRTWRVRAALYQQDWDAAMAWLQQLKPGAANKPVWRYWKARILAARGDQDKARKLYLGLATRNGYYGWLAASRLGQGYQPSDANVPTEKELREKIQSRPGIIRARELYQMGRFGQARVEWRLALSDESDSTWRQAGLLARQWGWHAEAIISLARAGVYDDLTVTYPTVYKNLVVAQSRKRALKPAWMYAVMRAESLFMPDAHSYAGARGLMQLMPATAREIARRNDAGLGGPDALYKPAVNIRLGSRYLQRLAGHFNGNLALASAAYNAGTSRVEHWLPDGAMPLDIWVENIPYNQTRRYVKRVLGFMAVYEWRLNDQVDSPEQRMQTVSAAINLAEVEQ